MEPEKKQKVQEEKEVEDSSTFEYHKTKGGRSIDVTFIITGKDGKAVPPAFCRDTSH